MSAFDLPWVRMIDPQPMVVELGVLELAVEPTDIHVNHHGDVNAGVLFSLAEMTGMGVVVTAAGAVPSDALVVIRSCEIDFVARARGRVQARAILDPEQCARVARLADGIDVDEKVDVEIRDRAQTLVCRASVRAAIKRRTSC